MHIYYAYLCIRRCYYVGGIRVLACDADDRIHFACRVARHKQDAKNPKSSKHKKTKFDQSEYTWNIVPRLWHPRVLPKRFVDKIWRFIVMSLQAMTEKKFFINEEMNNCTSGMKRSETPRLPAFERNASCVKAFLCIYFRHMNFIVFDRRIHPINFRIFYVLHVYKYTNL